jgi:hypothetical protein
MRRVIDHEHPLFIFQLYFASGDGEKEVLRYWNAIPEDLRPHSALFLRRVSGYPPQSIVKGILDAAQKHKVPIVLFVARNPLPQGAEDKLLAEYPCLIGLVPYEYGYRWASTPAFTWTAETCRKHGAYVVWNHLDGFSHMFETDPKDFRITDFPRMYDFFDKYGRNFILQSKANGTRYKDKKFDYEAFGEFIESSEVLAGTWLTGLTESWSWQPEDWLWYEKGYTKLFQFSEPGDRDRWGMYLHNNGINAICPENLLTQEVLLAAIHGCTTFTFEIGLTSGAEPGPWFRQTMGPLLQEIVKRKLIPSREEMLARSRAASSGTLKRLYAQTSCVLQHDGRYGLIPWLPSGTPARQQRKFEFLPGDYDYRLLPFLNALYPQEGRGRCFIERQGRRWYVMNPWENVNKETDFHLPLYTNTCRSLSGTLPSHTFAIVEEAGDRIEVYLSNFRLDKDEIWDRRHTSSAVRRIVADAEGNPNRSIRKTTLVLTGHEGDKAPALEIIGHDGARHEERWNARDKRYELDIHHNGIVRVVLRAAGSEAKKTPPQGLSRNLCLGKPAEASSSRKPCPAAAATDGVYETFWAPEGGDKPWLMVDLGEPVEITAYRLAYGLDANGPAIKFQFQGAAERSGPWVTLHEGACAGQSMRVYPIEAKGKHRFVRVAFDSPPDGCVVRELGVYTGPAEPLRQWAPLAESQDLAAILKLLPKAGSDAEHRAIEQAALGICRKSASPAQSSDMVIAAMGGADEWSAATLVRILGRLRGERALSAVRAAAKDSRREVVEAAQWALAEWPDIATLADKLDIAKTAADYSLREQALRTTVRLVDLNRDLRPEQRLPWLVEGLALASEERTKLMFMEALGYITHPASFEAIAFMMADRDSAKAASEAQKMCIFMIPKGHPADNRRALRNLLGLRKEDKAFCDRIRAVREFAEELAE